jgi:hypothetical protein
MKFMVHLNGSVERVFLEGSKWFVAAGDKDV